jgi:hypothetical protein
MDKARTKIYLSFLLAGALFVIFLANMVVASSPAPRFCGLCHQAEYSDWRASGHQEIGCNQCHQGPGVLGQGAQRLRVFSMIASAAVGSTDSSADVSSGVCLGCHESVAREKVTKNNLIMSHKEVIAARWNCGSCHREAVHKGGDRRPNRGTMDRCLTCHNEMGADTECETCHVADARLRKVSDNTPWRVAHGPDWRSNHGLLDLNLCQNCHTAQYCVRCHDIEDLPHSSGWLDTHGKTAKDERKREACYVCHDKKACSSCHGLPMPHPSDWLPNHLDVVKNQGKKGCLNCHMERGCDDCHSNHLHPGVDPRKLQENFFDQGRKWSGFGNN